MVALPEKQTRAAGTVHLAGRLGRLLALSRARRSAVRFSAAAMDAFLARAERSSGVEFAAAFFPPCLPNLRATSAIAARTSAEIFTLMSFMIHRTGYGDVVATLK